MDIEIQKAKTAIINDLPANYLINKKFLDDHPNVIFVFGDNTIRRGKKGGAVLRDHPQSYGFITKKYPNNNPSSFFYKDEYEKVLKKEITKLRKLIFTNKSKIFLITKLGAGLANRNGIWQLIKPHLIKLEKDHPNVVLLF